MRSGIEPAEPEVPLRVESSPVHEREETRRYLDMFYGLMLRRHSRKMLVAAASDDSSTADD
jgi:hypothetical protein